MSTNIIEDGPPQLWPLIKNPDGHFAIRGTLEEMIEPIDQILKKTECEQYFFHNGWEGDCFHRFPGVIDKIHGVMDYRGQEHITILYGDARAAEKYRGDRITFLSHVGWWQYSNLGDMITIQPDAKPFMSLNRTVHRHRLDHFRILAQLDLLKCGNISAHLRTVNSDAGVWVLHNQDIAHHFPIFIDGDNADRNTAGIVPRDLYERSQINFITETKFFEESIFLSEKSWKPLALGQPFMVLATCGHLALMRELGYRTDFAGIDQSYDDIKDHTTRLIAAHESLRKWCHMSKNERADCMSQNQEILHHNRNHWEKTNHMESTVSDRNLIQQNNQV